MAAPPIAERHKHHFHRQSPIKEAVRVATTADITIATALNAGDTIDGVTLAAGDRVLVKDQSTGSQNGIYVAGATPVRDYDVSTDDPAYGYLVLVLQGTANAATLWQNTNTSAPTIGTTALTFAAVSGGSGAPTTADYLVGTANGGLSAEIVVGTTPGGELGGTWGSPTVDATHAGTNHLQPVRKNSTGTVFERRRLNLIEGSNVTLTVADDSGNDEVDITIAATGGGGGGSLALAGDTGTAATVDDITFIGTGGIAVDVNDLGGGAAELTIDASGVSGGGGGRPLDSYALDGTYGDHFTGGSLSGIWTRRNYTSGAETYAQGKDATYIKIATTGRANGDGYFATAAGGDWTIGLKYILQAGEVSWGLVVVDSSGTGVGMQGIYTPHTPFAPLFFGVTTYSGYGGTYYEPYKSGSTASPNVPIYAVSPINIPIWLSLRKSGTNYYGAFSIDGEVWSPEAGPISWAGTVDRWGMMNLPLGAATNANGDILVDWFNKIA